MTRIDGLFEDPAREHSLRVCAHTLHTHAAAAAVDLPRMWGVTTQMTMMMVVMLVTRET